jgi:hypothetical protein
MATLTITLEVEVPETTATFEELQTFAAFYFAQEGGIGHDNPLYDCEYEVNKVECDYT